MALLPIVGAIIGILGILYFYLKHVTFMYWSSRGVAQAEPVVPIGSVWPIITGKKSMAEVVRDIYVEFKKRRIMGFYTITRPLLVIADPDVIRFILTKEFPSFHDRGMYHDEEVDPLSGILFFVPGNKWKNLRIKFTPTFTSGKIKYMFATVKKCSESLAEIVAENVQRNDLIEIKELMARFTTDVISSAAFGIEANSLRNPQSDFRDCGRQVFEAKPIKNLLMALCPSLLSLLRIGYFGSKVTDYFVGVFKDTVDYRTANNVVRQDFLQLVMQLMSKGSVDADEGEEPAHISEDSGGKITMMEGAAQAFVFWLAGFETSSTTATHCLYEMAVNEEIQEKLADEINGVLERFGGLSYESVMDMPYLHKVVSETMRKYPPLATLHRECTRDIELLDTGLRVKKGTAIVIPTLGLHWDPEIYPEPEKFDPERFNRENIASRHHYAYLPFGEGPRNCIGARFGLIQTKMAIVPLLSKYHFSLGPDTKVPLPLNRGSVVHCPDGPVMLRLKKRQ